MSCSVMFLHHLSVSICIDSSFQKMKLCRIFTCISGILKQSYFEYLFLHLSAFPFLFAFIFMQTSQVPGNRVHEAVLCQAVTKAGVQVQSCVMACCKRTDPVVEEGTRLLLRNTMFSVVPGCCITFLSLSCSHPLRGQQVRQLLQVNFRA